MSGLAGMAASAALVPASAAHAAPRPSAADGWQEVAVPPAEPAARFYAVAAAGPALAWAVGAQELQVGAGRPVAHTWNGTAWTPAGLGHLEGLVHLHAVAGNTEQAWALGVDVDDTALLFGWDGTTWQRETFPGQGEAGTTLTGIELAADGTAWASGRNGDKPGLLHHTAGGTWQWTPAIPGEAVPAPAHVHVASSGDIWAYGDVIARWDGDWTVIPRRLGLRATVSGLLPVADDDIWLTGYDYGAGGPPGKPPGIDFERWNGEEWTDVAAPFSVGMLSGIVADDQGRPELIPGWDFWDQPRAHYLRWDGTDWVGERGPETEDTFLPFALTRVPGAQGGHWAVGTTSFYRQPPAQLRIEHHA
ncbi:hypothetical protein DSC45_33505 [Streptomyces sp. YIM 130001]|nr:hypothetical protein DSC45_33505 [Streptomyces sp. YIM 130001]